ncbi:protein-glutamine gamma-glutamyltransferase [Metabacillus litoralis]|uniref:protein-glutamine gamma-glutamyltransferase n=1 Tax=Metabacillus litoralis TaxID=152268 RepID=UPI001CFD7812|nr:protein-glutamine gamma-glutamyltransferase [Metabacillus litoralis]
MIIIRNQPQSENQLTSSSYSTEQNEIIAKMSRYNNKYSFLNHEHLKFVLHLRLEIINSARNLYASKAKFTTFERAHCNENYWQLTAQGGFKLKSGVKPSVAIKDIYENGLLYGFECATAMVIIFYTGVLSSIDSRQFDRLYQGLYLRDWQSDEDLPIYTNRGNDYLPGDCLYFNNPQFNPNTPQWQGENAIDLGNDLYFGHGIGIKTAEGIIEALNKRRSAQATESAHLLSQVTRIDDNYLYQFSRVYSRNNETTFIATNSIVVRVGRNIVSL